MISSFADSFFPNYICKPGLLPCSVKIGMKKREHTSSFEVSFYFPVTFAGLACSVEVEIKRKKKEHTCHQHDPCLHQAIVTHQKVCPPKAFN